MKALPSYHFLKTELPLPKEIEAQIHCFRETVSAILEGRDERRLLIVGPCSIHDPLAAKEYAYRLKELSSEIASHFFIIMRTYCEKARTTLGWKGYLYDPFLDGSQAIEEGIRLTRRLMLDIAEIGIPMGTEFLDPLTAFYYDDLITWGSIGARTSSSQPHRQLASALRMPVGFKNGVAGNTSTAIQGVISASQPQIYPGISSLGTPSIVKTEGNPNAHIVLRGGETGPNYDPSSVQEVIHKLNASNLPCQIIVDCSHHNSRKEHRQQEISFRSVIEQLKNKTEAIRGLMLESHLFEGRQPHENNPSFLQYGISITDACLDWESTSSLIRWAYEELKKRNV